MALQTANQFQLGTDFSRLGSGIQQGQQIANQFQIGKQNEQKLDANAEESRIMSVVQGASELVNLPDDASKLNALYTRKQQLIQQGKPTQDTDEVIDLFERGNNHGANELIQGAVNMGIQTGRLKAPAAGPSAFEQAQTAKTLKQTELLEENGNIEIGTASQRDFNTYQDLLKTDPKKAEIFGRQAGFIRATEQEKADIKVDETARKEVAKANTKRVQGYIDSGIDAADATGNIKRSLELLKTVKTGGFDNVSLKAKQLFGIEGGDEAELSANLGKNVLAQLKPIFGAAFTAKEGERLEVIEAGFGKSTAGNIRLLENALTIVDRAARRGIAAAEDQGDEFTANEIRDVLASMQSVKEDQDLSQLSDEQLAAEIAKLQGGQ